MLKLKQLINITFLVILFSGFAYAERPKIAIIIDDIGAKASDAKAFSLPKNLSFAILPHTDYSTEFSFLAAQQNREVMLHMPMESLNGERLGEKPLLSTMYPEQIKQNLSLALSTVPHAVGVNNHMGSKLTQMTLPMRSVMDVLAQTNLFFIDSRTTKFTKAGLIANEYGVSSATRHVFLDHEQSRDFIYKQLALLIRKAKRNGKAIGIAHPYPSTLEHLPEALEALANEVDIVTVSEILQETNKFRISPQLASQPQATELLSINMSPQE